MNDQPLPITDGPMQSAGAATEEHGSPSPITSDTRRVREALRSLIVGQNEAIDLALVSLLAGGQ